MRSGAAEGADSAFESGHASENPDSMEIYLPWPGFNRNKSHLIIAPGTDKWAYDMIHRRFEWTERKKSSIQNLIARNMMQIFGRTGDDPVDVVVCWMDENGGGTKYAVSVAQDWKIPIRNLYRQREREAAEAFIQGSTEDWPVDSQ